MQSRFKFSATGLSAGFTPARMLSPAGIKRLVLVCEILLILLLAQQLAKLSWTFYPSPASSVSDWQPELSGQAAETAETVYPQLQNLHLFGQEPVKLEVPASQIDPNSVPRSRLSARVRGIVESIIPANSVAVIATGREERTYRIGETLKGTSAEIRDIYADRVIVMNRGRHEALLLYPDEAGRQVQRRSNVQMAQVRQEALKDPASIAEYLRISPAQRDGQLVGYRLNPGSKPELFHQSGLKPNDIAQSINGYDLTNTQAAMTLMSELQELTQLSLTIERDGRLYEIEIQL